jgi:hypothetical protein
LEVSGLFIENSSTFIALEVDVTPLVEPCEDANAFAKLFQSVYNNSCPQFFPFLSLSSEFLPLTPISDSDIFKALKPLRTSRSVGLDNFRGFVIKVCSDIFVPFLKYTFNAVRVFSAASHTLWKDAAIAPVY